MFKKKKKSPAYAHHPARDRAGTNRWSSVNIPSQSHFFFLSLELTPLLNVGLRFLTSFNYTPRKSTRMLAIREMSWGGSLEWWLGFGLAKRRGFGSGRKREEGPAGWVRRRRSGISLDWRRRDTLVKAQHKILSIQSQITNGLDQGVCVIRKQW